MTVKPEIWSLQSDVHEVVSSWLARSDPIPEHWKWHMNPINAMPYSELQDLGITGCFDLVFRARNTVLRLKSISDTLMRLSSVLQAESIAALTNYVAVSNMCSLITLPNELLSRIFECVVNGDESLTISTRRDAAVTLSHVCRYFRDTSLSCAQLWSNISGNSNMAALCLSRSKNAPLSVELTVDFTRADPESFNLGFDQLLPDVLHHSKRWRSLEIQFVSKRVRDWASRHISLGLDFRQEFRVLDAPSLDMLHIRNDQNSWSSFKDYHEFESWNAPKLRHVTSDHYFPLCLPGLANVTSFTLTLRLGQINVANVVKDLSRMKALEEFALTLRGEDFYDGSPLERTELPSVRRLRICILDAGTHEFHPSSSLKILFASLLFPRAIELHVSLRGGLKKAFPEADYVGLFLIKDIMCIFQYIEQYPRVEHFELEAIGFGDACRDNPAFYEIGYISLVVPIGLLPCMKHFAFYSNKRLFFSDEDQDGRSVFGDHPNVHWQPGAPGIILPALETITINIIHEFRWHRDVVSFVADIMEKQKERGEWGSFRELVIVETSLNQAYGQHADESAKTFVGDTALQWCRELLA